MPEPWPQVVRYPLSGLLGALFGSAELIARYRANPFRALNSWAAAGYLVVNVIAALVALGFIQAFNRTFGATDPLQIAFNQVTVAGLGSMAFFRSSVITVRGGSGDLGVGPHFILQVFLQPLDRGVDRQQGRLRLEQVQPIMAGVSFERANPALVDVCVFAMQNLAPEDPAQLGEQIADVAASPAPDSVKALELGLILEKWVGKDVLKQAVEKLGDRIKLNPPGVPPLP